MLVLIIISTNYTKINPYICQKPNSKHQRMKLVWTTITVCVVLLGCSEPKDSLARNTVGRLNSTKYVSYHVDYLTIEGKSAGDTIFTTTYAFFEKSETDTLLGYNFLVENSLVHPRFLIPIVLRDHYNGKKLTWTLESQVRNDISITESDHINKALLEDKVIGHLPMLLDLLNQKSFKKISATETSINDFYCIQYTLNCKDSIEHQLFIDASNRLPVLLRILINREQPFIKEYYYRNFVFTNTSKFPSTIDFTQESVKEILPVEAGDVFPNWKLETIKGDTLNLSGHNRTAKLIFLSGIHCGACQLQIPTTKRIYEHFSQRKDIKVFGLYPYDSRERLYIYAQEKQIDYPIAFNSFTNIDERYELFQKLRYPIPSLILIDKDNRIVWIKTGFNADDADDYFTDVVEMTTKSQKKTRR